MALKLGPIAVVVAALALAGCGNTEAPSARAVAGNALLAQVGRLTGRAPSPSRVTLTDAQLRAYPAPLLLVETPSRDAEAGVVVQVANGNAVTWVTPDAITLTLRDGVLIQTRGMGDDLMSAAVPDVRRTRGDAVHDAFTLGGDETIRRTRYLCRIADAGPAQVVVAGVVYATRHVTEDCTAEGGDTFRNDYWIEGDGLIRKSRQFATAGTGYLVISDVKG